MKIYVAGSTKEMTTVKQLHRIVKSLGHEITFDWTKRVEELGDAHRVPVPHEARREGAYLDRDGIAEANGMIVWLSPEMMGTLIEVGMATQREIPILLLESQPERMSIFYDMDHITLEHINEGERMDLVISDWIEREL